MDIRQFRRGSLTRPHFSTPRHGRRPGNERRWGGQAEAQSQDPQGPSSSARSSHSWNTTKRSPVQILQKVALGRHGCSWNSRVLAPAQVQINSSSPLAFLELIHSPLLLLSPPRKKSRTLESSLSVPTIRPTQEGLQHPPESIIHQIYASRTGTLAPIDPNTEWVKKQILLGTRSLPKMAAQVQKMQKYCKLRDISDMQLPDFYRYLHFASTTCLPQSVAGYASTIKNAALRLGLAWASDPIVPLLIRGIRSQATPPEGANPMTVDNFHLLQGKQPLIQSGIPGGAETRRSLQSHEANDYIHSARLVAPSVAVPATSIYHDPDQGREQNRRYRSGSHPVCGLRTSSGSGSSAAIEYLQQNGTRERTHFLQQVRALSSSAIASRQNDGPLLQKGGTATSSSRHCKQSTAAIDSTADVETQIGQRGSTIRDDHLLRPLHHMLHPASEGSHGCGGDPQTKDHERSLVRTGTLWNGTDEPRWLRRLLDGKHRGAIPGVRKTPNPQWPSHSPAVKALGIATILADMRISFPLRSRLTVLLKQLDTLVDAGRSAAAEPKTVDPNASPIRRPPAEPPPAARDSPITAKTIKALLKSGNAELVPQKDLADALVNTMVFLTPEPKKLRNRVITWSIWANWVADNVFHYEWDHNVSKQADVLDIVEDVNRAATAAVFDLTCSFYQVELPEHVRRAFVFSFKGTKYRFRKLPMGFTLSAEILQLITQAIAEAALFETARTKFVDPDTCATGGFARVHVDNILYCGTAAVVQKLISATVDVAKQWGVSFSESTVTPLETVKFHAVELDFKNKEARLTKNAVDKLAMIDLLLTQIIQGASATVPWPLAWSEFPLLSVIGNLTFSARIMWRASRFHEGSMAQFYSTMQLFRAAGSALQGGRDHLHIAKAALIQMRELCRAIPFAAAVVTSSTSETEGLCITTDASCTGGGFIITNGSNRQVIAEIPFPWPTRVTPSQMGVYEIRAITMGVANLPFSAEWTSIHVFTDSMIALGAVKKGYSPSYEVNRELIMLFSMCRKRRVTITGMSFVTSSQNKADYWSRLLGPDSMTSSSSSALPPATSGTKPLAWVWDDVRFSLDGEGLRIVAAPDQSADGRNAESQQAEEEIYRPVRVESTDRRRGNPGGDHQWKEYI